MKIFIHVCPRRTSKCEISRETNLSPQSHPHESGSSVEVLLCLRVCGFICGVCAVLICSHFSFFCCLGRFVLGDRGISWVSSCIILYMIESCIARTLDHEECEEIQITESIKCKRKVQGVLQSQSAAIPYTKRKRKQTKPNKCKSNKRTKSIKISSLFPKRGNSNAKRTEKYKNKITQGKS